MKSRDKSTEKPAKLLMSEKKRDPTNWEGLQGKKPFG